MPISLGCGLLGSCAVDVSGSGRVGEVGDMSMMPQVDRAAPLRFLRVAFEPSDWLAVFLKSYETGQVLRSGSGGLPQPRSPHSADQEWSASRAAPQCDSTHNAAGAVQPAHSGLS